MERQIPAESGLIELRTRSATKQPERFSLMKYSTTKKYTLKQSIIEFGKRIFTPICHGFAAHTWGSSHFHLSTKWVCLYFVCPFYREYFIVPFLSVPNEAEHYYTRNCLSPGSGTFCKLSTLWERWTMSTVQSLGTSWISYRNRCPFSGV